MRFLTDPVAIKHPEAWVILAVALLAILLTLTHKVRNGQLVLMSREAYMDDMTEAAFYGYFEGAEACRNRGGYTFTHRRK